VNIDTQLQQRVLDELKWDPSVQANAIGVEVQNGVVTLAGHVESFARRRAAERATERVAGVRGVVMEIDVSLPGSSERQDTDLAQAAIRALDWNAAVPHGSVKIVVNNGWVTLAGQVDWGYQRAAAVGSVQNLVGVRGIKNEIAVRARRVNANAVRQRIRGAVHRQAQIDANAINVDVDGGTVTLAGVVDSWSERLAARNAAWSVPGVQEVNDNIEVAEQSVHT
jgi:osmotically-inducible protein OsmY